MAASVVPSSSNELKKTKDINGDISVASSLNSVVKKQFTNMTDQYNLYASTINKMEENSLNKMKTLVSEFEADFTKFSEKKNKAAGTRARKTAQELKALLQTLRTEILENRKNENG